MKKVVYRLCSRYHCSGASSITAHRCVISQMFLGGRGRSKTYRSSLKQQPKCHNIRKQQTSPDLTPNAKALTMQGNSDADIWRPWSSNKQNKMKTLQLIDYSSTSSSDDEAVAVERSSSGAVVATPGGGGGGGGGDVLLQEPRVSSSRTTKSESPRQQVSR